MSYKLINKAKQPIIRSLADGSTLRIPTGGETTITDSQYSEDIAHLSEVGLLKVVKSEVKKKEQTTSDEQTNSKEEKKNGKS